MILRTDVLLEQLVLDEVPHDFAQDVASINMICHTIIKDADLAVVEVAVLAVVFGVVAVTHLLATTFIFHKIYLMLFHLINEAKLLRPVIIYGANAILTTDLFNQLLPQ